jgi:hypothetical protein
MAPEVHGRFGVGVAVQIAKVVSQVTTKDRNYTHAWSQVSTTAQRGTSFMMKIDMRVLAITRRSACSLTLDHLHYSGVSPRPISQ